MIKETATATEDKIAAIVSMAAENWAIGGINLNNNERNNGAEEKDNIGRFPWGCCYLCWAYTASLEGFYC